MPTVLWHAYRPRLVACWYVLRLTQITALFSSLIVRLSGIALASFVSGLGEVTYLQYTTRYPYNVTAQCVGWFASGTGAAGLAGALAWWIVRPLGVRTGLGALSILPFGMAIAFFGLLPTPPTSSSTRRSGRSSDEAAQSLMGSETNGEDDSAEEPRQQPADSLSFAYKMQLLRPMLIPYILPLVTVYFAEYTINQGIVRTVANAGPYSAVPCPRRKQALAPFDHDSYAARLLPSIPAHIPGMSTFLMQTFVFFSRSYTSVLRLPPIPKKWLWAPAMVQGSLMFFLTSESVFAWFRESIARSLVIVLIAVEGLAGGAA